MSIAAGEVARVARLGGLRLTAKQQEHFRTQLNDVLRYMRRLEEVDTACVTPTFHVVSSSSPLRPDRVRSSLPQSRVLKGAPDKQQDLFRVPRVL